MRHHEIGLADLNVSHKKDVDVELAGPVSHGANPARQLLEPVRDLEELPGTEVRLEADNAIQVPVLGLWGADRSRLVDRRDREVRIEAAEDPHGQLEITQAIAYVRAET